MEFSNEELWEQLRSGKRSAIEDLYRFNYQVLYSYALKISGDKELSMDCVQDLFVRLWEKREQLNEVSKVRSYLLQSIWHSVVKIMKKQNKNVLINENGHYDIEVVFPHLDSLIVSQEKDAKKKTLDHALNNLSSRQKEIIFMQYYEGLTIDEIQQITELKYQSIKNLTHRAMIVLRESFNLKKK
jgi:RNA polymerase sigma factor (sigma-70 family)